MRALFLSDVKAAHPLGERYWRRSGILQHCGAMFSPFSKLVQRTSRFAGQPGYPALGGAIAAADYLIPGAPTNAILVASVLPRPARWRRVGIAFALGDAAGAVILATLMSLFGEPIAAWAREGEPGPLWARIESYVSAYGLLTLAALAVTPLPTRIATAALALTGTSPLTIGLVVLAGRLVAYPAMAYLAARAPSALLRFYPVARWWARHVESARTAGDHSNT